MSYDSEWRLAVRGTIQSIDRLTSWAEERRDVAPIDELLIWDEILRHVANDFGTPRRRTRVWAHTYPCGRLHWDEIVGEILLRARDRFHLRAAYARLGQDLDDHEFDNDPRGFCIPYRFELVDPE
jgi:hypothetical protein